jgi:hypothetical protein
MFEILRELIVPAEPAHEFIELDSYRETVVERAASTLEALVPLPEVVEGAEAVPVEPEIPGLSAEIIQLDIEQIYAETEAIRGENDVEAA